VLRARLNCIKTLRWRITKNGRGRPALPEGEKRMHIVTFRLTESELLALQEEAREYGLTLSGLIRAKLFNGLEATASIGEEIDGSL